jgi:hypothetical protein
MPCRGCIGGDSVHVSIGRANLDGTGVNQRFIAGMTSAGDTAVDSSHVYWSGGSEWSAKIAIGRADLAGSHADPLFFIPPKQLNFEAI